MSPRKCDYLSVQYEPSIAFYLTKAPEDAWALSMLGTKYRAFYVEAHKFLVPYATLVQVLFFYFSVVFEVALFTTISNILFLLGHRNKQLRRQNFPC